MSAVTRFAPSPTGRLHVGNIRTALMNWVIARQAGGTFILRLDDTDAERSTDAYADGIRDDMAWLGLTSDSEARQSERMARYEAARAKLADMGRLYACYETPEELETQRKLLRARGLPPVYDRSALKLSDDEKARLEADGRQPHWRFLLEDKPIAFEDLIRGPVSFEPGHVSDPVLMRENGVPTYTLASAVDDIEMGVTHVVRGEDHVANTAVQIDLIAALGGAPIQFGHHPLLTEASGEGLSKRKGGASIAELRDEGLEPLAVLSFLGRLGTSDPIEPLHTLQMLIDGFAFSKISRNPPRYDPDELRALNAKWLHGASLTDVTQHLDALGLSDVDETFWLAVRGNLETLADAATWWAVCHQPTEPVIAGDDKDFIAAAAGLLPKEPWDQETWKAWTTAVKEVSGRKGKALFMPLRLALTGLDHGPELKDLLPIIGRERALVRLEGDKA
ncbi:MAG: glutamate--tRNA ligase [Pseudomonadota bacterium]